VQSVFDTLNSVGGIYVAMFVVAVISGVFPLVNSELALVALARTVDSWPKLIVVGVIVALGQTVTHATLFESARSLTKLGEKRRQRFEARIARAREVVNKWQTSELLLLASAATVGLPPMMLVAVVGGALGIRFRTFVLIGLTGRVARFTTIVILAHVV